MSVTDLWLPILLAAVLVFVVSSLVHMVLPIHKGDYQKLPNEDAVLKALRENSVPPGEYMFPCPSSMKDMGSPAMLEKFKLGPVGSAVIRPTGVPNIGKNLVQWFAFSIVVGILVAYAASIALQRGESFVTVFRTTSVMAWIGYGVSHAQDSIWKGVRWTISIKFFFDGLLYGLATGLAFAWLWPAAA